ncbi:UNVERIFIED_CONTAM: hypothetical protein Sradi_3572800 [Sesamum radiatum]|uniref:Uncharacterized protein n=1 Tax=Sesamum radiatum TaxID=300843 RepID=A0AAW2QH73_SESRA
MDADCIINIQSREAPEPDRLVWHLGKKGSFSVRTVYDVAVTLEAQEVGSSSSSEVQEQFEAGVSFGKLRCHRMCVYLRSAAVGMPFLPTQTFLF